MWRGRGGTEDKITGHIGGERFVLITEALGLVDPGLIGSAPVFRAAAQGRDDPAPVTAQLASHGRAILPLSPVHGRWRDDITGGLVLSWVRRSRSGFAWRDGIDVPLAEDSETYRVAIVADESVVADHVVYEPLLVVNAATLSAWRAMAGQSLTAVVVQQGGLGLSPPLQIALPI